MGDTNTPLTHIQILILHPATHTHPHSFLCIFQINPTWYLKVANYDGSQGFQSELERSSQFSIIRAGHPPSTSFCNNICFASLTLIQKELSVLQCGMPLEIPAGTFFTLTVKNLFHWISQNGMICTELAYLVWLPNEIINFVGIQIQGAFLTGPTLKVYKMSKSLPNKLAKVGAAILISNLKLWMTDSLTHSD